LLGGISNAFQDTNVDVESRLSMLEDVLLQADIGIDITALY
jgi:hypothetical protein